MVVSVEALSAGELGEFIARSSAEYVRERMEAGDSREYAEQRSAQSNAEYFPEGRPAAGQHVLRVLDGGESGTDGEAVAVGTLWLGPFDPKHPHDWWVFDIEIGEEFRGRGYGRAAMLLAEEVARGNGARKLGLNVFGHNTVAQHLYSSLGYDVTAINMAKPL